MSMASFCQLHDIPIGSFKSYVCADESKRKQLGCGVGNSAKSVIDEDTSQFLVDVMRRRDRGDDGMSRPECS